MSGSPVRVEAKMFGDRRFKRLAQAVGHTRQDVSFRMIEIWSIATDNARECVDLFDIADVFEMDEATVREVIVGAELGAECACGREDCLKMTGGDRLGPDGWKNKRSRVAKQNGSRSKGRPKKKPNGLPEAKPTGLQDEEPDGLSVQTESVSESEPSGVTSSVSQVKPTGEEEEEHEEEEEAEEQKLVRVAIAAPRNKGRYLEAEKLFQLQETKRAELRAEGVKGRPLPVCAGTAHLDPIADMLATYGFDQCVHVLEVYAAESRASKSMRWFDGVTNWRPDNFKRAVAKTVEMATAESASETWDPYAGEHAFSTNPVPDALSAEEALALIADADSGGEGVEGPDV